MKKSLQIENDPALNHLAQVTLFERIQDTFNLHPGNIVDGVISLARRESRSPFEVVKDLRTSVVTEFIFVLRTAGDMICDSEWEEPCRKNPPKYWGKIRSEFKLYPEKIARTYPKKARAIDLTAVQVVDGLRKVVPEVISWTLDEVEEILRKRGVK